jgi:thiamine biosynthesis lipoprotein
LVDAHKRTLQLPEGVGLDFGGVAKGWAAHQAMRRLSAVGPALVSGGGDIAISGPPSDGEPWPIDVVNPLEPSSFLETVFLDRGGVATSGRDRRHRNPAGIPKHHVIDPRTGVPAQTDVLTATVVGPTVMQAEALAKAVMISGSQAGLAWLDHDEAFEGLLVLEDGQQLYSRNFEKYL